MVAGDANAQEPEIKRPFGVTDIGLNNPEILSAAYGREALAWPGGDDLAWPKDMAGLRQLGLAGAQGVNAEQAVFTKTPSPAYSDNSSYLSLARPFGNSVEAAYAERQTMFASANGAAADLKPVPDLAGIRATSGRASESSLPLHSRFIKA